MSRSQSVAELLSGVQTVMDELGEPIEVGQLSGGQDPVSGFKTPAVFVLDTTYTGVLMPLDEKTRAQMLPTVGGSPDRIPGFVAYLLNVPGTPLTGASKLRLRGTVYDPVAAPADIGGVGIAWELLLRAGV